jgi:hypothetical protein
MTLRGGSATPKGQNTLLHFFFYSLAMGRRTTPMGVVATLMVAKEVAQPPLLFFFLFFFNFLFFVFNIFVFLSFIIFNFLINF